MNLDTEAKSQTVQTGNMGSEPMNSNGPGTEPELQLLITDKGFEEPLYKSLFRGLDEFFFPKKLPPLVLQSKPEPVKDIWGFYSNWKAGAVGVAGYYTLLTVIGVLAVFIGHRIVSAAPAQKVTVTLVDPGELPALKPSKTQVGGGGGGGDRDVLQQSKGKLPKFAMTQITPPVVVVRNENPKLAVEPTIVIPPQVQLASNNMPNLGDPMAHAVVPSNGTGSGGMPAPVSRTDRNTSSPFSSALSSTSPPRDVWRSGLAARFCSACSSRRASP